MTDKPDSAIFGRRVMSEECVELTRNARTGEEFIARNSREVKEGWDGTEEKVVSREVEVNACGHLHSLGQPRAVCEECSRQAGKHKTVFVCGDCSVQCEQCGRLLCKQHTRPGPDGHRYCSRRCLKKAMKLYVPAAPLCTPSCPGAGPSMPVGASSPNSNVSPRQSILSRILNWW